MSKKALVTLPNQVAVPINRLSALLDLLEECTHVEYIYQDVWRIVDYTKEDMAVNYGPCPDLVTEEELQEMLEEYRNSPENTSDD